MKDFDIREALIKSGKEEFLVHGFDKASLRAICAAANVTTGAFYAYFRKKEDLFSAIVDPMLNNYHKLYFTVVDATLKDVNSNEQTELRIIEFLYDHKDEFRLLFECSAGTRYEGFKDMLLNSLFMDTYQQCFDQYAGRPVDPALVRVFMHMKFTQYMELVYEGYPMEDIRRLVRYYAGFTRAGFDSLIHTIKNEIN
ncbi:MAG: TetR/AcrR family transcriptional regulator [Clostridia bacterium]|nr:TetR/AcrR family transcriptional regulator [Clostridia bacterium]